MSRHCYRFKNVINPSHRRGLLVSALTAMSLVLISFKVDASNSEDLNQANYISLQSKQVGELGRMKARMNRGVYQSRSRLSSRLNKFEEDHSSEAIEPVEMDQESNFEAVEPVSEELVGQDYAQATSRKGVLRKIADYLMSQELVLPEHEAEVEEEIPVWKGYLQEKGPSRVMVQEEVEPELVDLPDEVWALIMGGKTIRNTYDETVDLRRKLEEEALEEMIQEEEVEIPLDEIEELPVEHEVQDPVINELDFEQENDSYQKLIDLFSQPALAMPTPKINEQDGMLSFNRGGYGSLDPESVREGSQARFQIRKN